MSEKKKVYGADIQTRKQENPQMYITMGATPEERAKAIQIVGQAINSINPLLQSARANYYSNILPDVSVREGMTRADYEVFRPEEAIPSDPRRAAVMARHAYFKVGILRNIIDLMAEFTTQGIQIIHPVKSVETFCKNWAKRVEFYDRSERFCNLLYREGNVVIQRSTARQKAKDKKDIQQGNVSMGADMEIVRPEPVVKGEIPWDYTFINPMLLHIRGGEDLAKFTGRTRYAIRIDEKLLKKIVSPRDDDERELRDNVPDYIIQAAINGQKTIKLDDTKVTAWFYKKDDWYIWSYPMIYSILDDLVLLRKLKLADLAALDGAISHVRLWRLGSLEHGIFPGPGSIAKLASILANNTGVGAIDMIWGPDLDLVETSTDVYRFLGSEKYTATLDAIYDGLGIPATLRSGKGKGFSDSFLSLRTLIERLNYGRSILCNFWEQEFKILQQACGWQKPPQLKFNFMVLSDEAAYRRLIIELVDRDIISLETARERFGEMPELEEIRIRREAKARESNRVPPKASPFHTPEKEFQLEKVFAQSGNVTPSQVGIELKPRKPGEETPTEHDAKNAPPPAPVVGGKPKKANGRPVGKKDALPRKKRRVLPRTSASAGENYFVTRAWATKVQEQIAEIVNPVYLQSINKKNMRQLTDEEAGNVENFKFAILCSLEPYSEFNEDRFIEMTQKEKSVNIPTVVELLLSQTLSAFAQQNNRSPTIDELRFFQSEVYSLYVQSEPNELEDDKDGQD